MTDRISYKSQVSTENRLLATLPDEVFNRLLYTQALITQISQTAVCNRLQTVEQRLCRWLLLTIDRVESAELRLTQEFIANMIGGRRESVTKAARHLASGGVDPLRPRRHYDPRSPRLGSSQLQVLSGG
jgi:CRP-like cAMP-binding protein